MQNVPFFFSSAITIGQRTVQEGIWKEMRLGEENNQSTNYLISLFEKGSPSIIKFSVEQCIYHVVDYSITRCLGTDN